MTSVYALITIVDRGKSAAVQKIFRGQQLSSGLILRGHGTANSEIMDMLGLDEPEKEMLVTVACGETCHGLMETLQQEMHLDHPGTGIAFTCPLTGISVAASDLVEGKLTAQTAHKEEKPMENAMEMLLTVVDSETTDIVVHAAKEAGAHGGTVLKAREMGADEKIFGITVQPEKEIVLMVVPEAQTREILKAVCTAVLAQTGEHALAFSLPVGETVGLKK